MRKFIIFICVFFALLGLGGLLASCYALSSFWQSLLISFSVALIQLVLGMLIVNLYLDQENKKSVATAILYSSEKSIADYHNTFLEFLWEEFGQKRWGEIVSMYFEGNGAPEAIALEDRNKAFNVIKNHYEEIRRLLSSAAEQVEEMSKSGILTFDAGIHSHAWAAKESAKDFLKIDINTPDVNITKVFEHCIDFDLHSQRLRMSLYKLVDKKDD